MHYLVDMDTLLHTGAALGQKVTYYVGGQSFDKHRDALEIADGDRSIIKSEITDLGYQAASSAVKNMLDGIHAVDEDGNFEYFMGPKTKTFRYWVSSEYKLNRKDRAPAIHYQGLNDALRSCEFTDSITYEDYLEADDLITMRAYYLLQNGEEVCIVSTDKDLKQIPRTEFYDWKKHVGEKIDPFTAAYNLVTQVLTGDSTDNIKGIKGIGPATAKKLLKDCKTKQEMLDVAWEQYLKAYNEDRRLAKAAMTETIVLVRMLRTREEQAKLFAKYNVGDESCFSDA